MPQPRRRSMVGAFILISIGALFLYGNLRPGVDPWGVLSRYWPLILIAVGLGKLWDYRRARNAGLTGARAWINGPEVAVLILLVVCAVAVSHGFGRGKQEHYSQSIDRQGVEKLTMAVEMPAGNLRIFGGAEKLLQADFDYAQREGRPTISYSVSGKEGDLNITQREVETHFYGRTENNWKLRLNDDVPLDLTLQLGAGEEDLNFSGLPLNRLDVHVGAGTMNADFSGPWKHDLDASIEGGVGTATIRLPQDVGVKVHATGGIGTVHAPALQKDGDDYVNQAYGKSPVTLRIEVQGGIGTISLLPAT
jgi:N-terminal domain of toast_rack, DUF2154/Domain of unknown function (DUF5668)